VFALVRSLLNGYELAGAPSFLAPDIASTSQFRDARGTTVRQSPGIGDRQRDVAFWFEVT